MNDINSTVHIFTITSDIIADAYCGINIRISFKLYLHLKPTDDVTNSSLRYQRPLLISVIGLCDRNKIIHLSISEIHINVWYLELELVKLTIGQKLVLLITKRIFLYGNTNYRDQRFEVLLTVKYYLCKKLIANAIKYIDEQ